MSERRVSVLERAVGGDRAALKVLLAESHFQLLRRLGRRIPADLRSVLDPDDVIQDVHIEVFRRIREFRPHELDSFQRWVAAVALTRLRNAIKRHRAAKRGGAGFGSPAGRLQRQVENSTVALFEQVAATKGTPSRSFARHEAISALRMALDQLPVDYRRAVWLVHIEGRPVKDAALAMGRSERAIHGLCRRALRRLQEQLGPGSQFLTRKD